ncbi:hypothetical protein [Meridianimaribacter sp. CL38]|uniref:hypothetical protein n=1 Tax=Meridianimaribacter sp. CL38 TaxID=2213021 RepID=UPI00103B099A|nr:hypothetical protein [Meridianimaribacter sp. CL38]
MRKLYLIACVFCYFLSHAQSPEKMSYQAVIRNASNELVSNASVGMQISILQGNSTGTAVYTETHAPVTNQNGLISIEIGSGSVISGDLSTIDWSSDTYFIKTETDPDGGTNYTIIATSQLLSVPYALHAKTASTVTNPVLMEPYILGRSYPSDDGKFSYNGKTGWQAANEMCKDSYPEEPYARAFTAEQITQAIVIGNYSSNSNYDNVPFWVITSSVTKGDSFNDSGFNNSQNFSENAGDVSRGVRGTITFNYTSIGNGGGLTIPRFFNVEQEVINGLNYPCLCGTYKPAEQN